MRESGGVLPDLGVLPAMPVGFAGNAGTQDSGDVWGGIDFLGPHLDLPTW